MAESNQAFIFKILQHLSNDEMKTFLILNKEDISRCKLENINAVDATKLIMAYSETPLECLKDFLEEIPRKDLVIKINDKIEADIQNKGEAQDNVTSEVINSCPGSSNHPTYTGKYTLFDLEDYATKNQDQLIMHLEDILEPDEFNELKKQLMCSVLNTFFSFTAQKYYELYINGEVKDFLETTADKPKKIPMKLLNILFSKKKKNRKRKVQEQMQRESNINLKKKRFVNIDDDDDSVPDKVIFGIENEKKIPIPPNQHKPGNEDSNVIEEHGLGKDSRMATENSMKKIS
ncbi:uncharacterized protein LOC132711856 [Pantherophis guttatus]|uniref:Uncharacterized protein LOC132711856 n=1 Tax=Pantherophis guttatus TaxID=94885 RepID=A0ABM3ZH32_PANGU|nr:uncharacterized protein LOC132711856 [Pantherophis guttatus]